MQIYDNSFEYFLKQDLPVLEDFKNIQLQSQFNNILSNNAKYLAHEYLKPSYFLDKATLNKLNETSPIMQEILKDLFYRAGYKKDYFIKGKTKLERLQAER